MNKQKFLPRIGQDEIDAVLEVLGRDPVTLSGYYKNFYGGPSIQAFQNDLEAYTTAKFAELCTNGTSALQLAMMATGIGRGSRVAIPPLTFSATATSVINVGAEPVFVDVERENYNMSPQAFWRLCEKQRVDAVIPVHLLGVPCKMNEFMAMANDYDMVVIEDNAQALGALFRNKPLGSWGHAATLSFQETKVITTAGEGGAVLTDDPVVAQKIRALKNHGQQYPDPESGVPANFTCHNMRMTEVQAAFGSAQLKKLDRFNMMMRENRFILKDLLEPLGFTFQEATTEAGTHANYYILGTVYEGPERHEIVQTLHEHGWGEPKPGATIGLGYTQPIYKLPLLKQYRTFCPVAEWLCDHYVWFDVHRWQTPEMFKRVAKQIEGVIKEVLR